MPWNYKSSEALMQWLTSSNLINRTQNDAVGIAGPGLKEKTSSKQTNSNLKQLIRTKNEDKGRATSAVELDDPNNFVLESGLIDYCVILGILHYRTYD